MNNADLTQEIVNLQVQIQNTKADLINLADQLNNIIETLEQIDALSD